MEHSQFEMMKSRDGNSTSEHWGTLVGQTDQARRTAVNEIARIEVVLVGMCEVREWVPWKKQGGEGVNSSWIGTSDENNNKNLTCAA